MFNSVVALLDTRSCTSNPGHDSLDTCVVSEFSTQRSRAAAGLLVPLWSAIGACTPELERRAEGWFETSGATALDDIVEYGLTESFLDHLELKQVQRLKASKFLQARMMSSQEKDSSHPSAPGSKKAAVKRLDLRSVEATQASQKAESQNQLWWLARPGMPPVARRSSSILRRGRSSSRSASTGSRVSFSVDTKGGSGCPGDKSPPSKGRACRNHSRTRNQRHRQHSTPVLPFQTSRQTSPARLTSVPLQVPQARFAWLDDSITGAPPISVAGLDATSVAVGQVLAEPARLAWVDNSISGAGLDATSVTVGQAVEVYSRSKRRWVSARVLEVHPDGSVNVSYDECDAQRLIPARLLRDLLRPLESSAMLPAAGGAGGGITGSALVSVYCESLGAWVVARVRSILSDGSVVVQGVGVDVLMVLGAREQQLLMRPLSSIHSPVT